MIDPAQAAAMWPPPPVVPVDVPVLVPQKRVAAPPVTTLLVTETLPSSQDTMEAMWVIGGE